MVLCCIVKLFEHSSKLRLCRSLHNRSISGVVNRAQISCLINVGRWAGLGFVLHNLVTGSGINDSDHHDHGMGMVLVKYRDICISHHQHRQQSQRINTGKHTRHWNVTKTTSNDYL